MKTKLEKWSVDEDPSANGYYSVIDDEGWRVAWVKDRRTALLIAAAPDLEWALENAITELRFNNVNANGVQRVNSTIDILMPRLLNALNKVKGITIK